MSILDSFSLRGKVILVTGATSGIGRAVAMACAEAGAVVAAVGRDERRLSELSDELKMRSHVSCAVCKADVTRFDEIPDVVSDIVAKCGRISGFVHCAGAASTVPLRTMDAEEYRRLYDVNAVAGFEFARHISSRKNSENAGSMVFIASVSALKGEAKILGYAASKGAVIAGVQALAAELSRRKIRVNCLCPGLVLDTQTGSGTLTALTETKQAELIGKHCLGPGKADDLTGPAVFLLSDASSWMTGTLLRVDGGYCL